MLNHSVRSYLEFTVLVGHSKKVKLEMISKLTEGICKLMRLSLFKHLKTI